MMALWLGGTSSACTEPLIVTLVAKTRGYPLLSICGIITEPIAEVSATDEPDMPLRSVVASTLTTESPPRTRINPTSTSANATMRRAMPPSAMMAPASTKNGMVSIATLLTPLEIFSITASERDADPQRAGDARRARANRRSARRSAKQKNIVPRRTAMSISSLPGPAKDPLRGSAQARFPDARQNDRAAGR